MSLSISIVTPNFNMGRYLTDTIESVLGNLKAGDEYFVIDGGSTDDSLDTLRHFDPQLTDWISEPDQGYADALAKGFSRASGDVLCWINCGDLMLPGTLDAVRHEMETTKGSFVFGDDVYINEEGFVIKYSRGFVPDLRSAMLYGGWTPLQDACYWRRSLYEHVGGIDPKVHYAADYDLFLRMAIHGNAVYVPQVFSAFRKHDGQKSITGSKAYHEERQSIRKRELARMKGALLTKSLRSLWYAAAIRWRVHISQRYWTRSDLTGRPVGELSCATYWPLSYARRS